MLCHWFVVCSSWTKSCQTSDSLFYLQRIMDSLNNKIDYFLFFLFIFIFLYSYIPPSLEYGFDKTAYGYGIFTDVAGNVEKIPECPARNVACPCARHDD